MKETIFGSQVRELAGDFCEIGIDTIIDEGLFREVPIVKTVVSVAKTAQNVRDRNLLRQTLAFVKTLNDDSVSQDVLEEHKARLDNDPKFAEEELGRILVILDSNIDLKKSHLLAHLYRGYIYGEVSWREFCELSEVVKRLFLADYDLLISISTGAIYDTTQCQGYQADRLAALGLLSKTMKSMMLGPGPNSSQTQSYLSITPLGAQLCRYARGGSRPDRLALSSE